MNLSVVIRILLKCAFAVLLPLISMAQSHVVQDTWQDYGQEIWAWDSISVKHGFHYRPGTNSTQHHLFIDRKAISSDQWQGQYDHFCQENEFPSPIDLSKIPGNHGGTFSVNEFGAAEYVYTLDLPKGINGLTPNLGMIYNSNNGVPSELGKGWGVIGWSKVYRGNKTRHIDGYNAGITGTPSDALYLDGKRYVNCGGVFKPFIEDYSFLEVDREDENGPLSFILHQKDGLKKYFGTSADARFMVDRFGREFPSQYFLESIEDGDGNVIDFSYRRSGKNIVLDEVSYGRNLNNNSPHFGKVEFFYKQRLDTHQYVEDGVMKSYDLLLERIQTTVMGEVYCSYEFNFLENDNSTFIESISKIDSKGRSFNDVRFLYSCSFWDFAEENVEKLEFDLATQNLIIDINGDGYDDIVNTVLHIDKGGVGGEKMKISINNLQNGFSSENDLIFNHKNENYYSTEVGDFDGDGALDIALFGYRDFSTDTHTAKHTSLDQLILIKWNIVSEDFEVNDYSNEIPENIMNFPTTYDKTGHLVGDFDLDGKSEIVVSFFNEESQRKENHVFNPLENQVFDHVMNGGVGLYDIGYYGTGKGLYDVDGNGSLDFFRLSDGSGEDEEVKISIQYSGTTLFIVSEGATHRPTWFLIDRDGSDVSHNMIQHYEGDFNGDGFVDLFYTKDHQVIDGLPRPVKSDEYFIWFGDERGEGIEVPVGFDQPVGNFSIAHDEPDPNYRTYAWTFPVRAGDLNGDGLTDFIFVGDFERENWTSSKLEILISNGKGFDVYYYHFSEPLVINNFSDYAAETVFNTGDFDGDGLSELWISNLVGGGSDLLIGMEHMDGASSKITGVANGYNQLTEVHYGLNKQTEVFSPQEKLQGYNSIKKGVLQVDSLINKDTWGEIVSKEYFNYSAIEVKQGVGILGMKSQVRTVFNPYSKRSKITSFSKDKFENLDSYLLKEISVGAIEKEDENEESAEISRETFSWAVENTIYGRKKIIKTVATTLDIQNQIERKVVIQPENVSEYGNLSQRLTSTELLSSGEKISSSEFFTGFFAKDFGEIPNTWRNKQIINTYNNAEVSKTIRRETHFGKISKEIYFEGEAEIERSKLFEYNSFGTVNKLTSEALNENQEIVQMSQRAEWSDDGRFLMNLNRDLGGGEELIYQVNSINSVFGKPTSFSNQFGKETRLYYNGNGEVEKLDFDNSFSKEVNYQWHLGSGENDIETSGKSVLKATIEATGTLPVELILDGNGRELSRKSYINDIATFQKRLYGQGGDEIEITQPYFEGSFTPTSFVEKFDLLGRLVSKDTPRGNFTSLYDINETKIAGPGTNSTFLKNVFGGVSSVSNEYGELNNVFNVQGLMDSITVNGILVSDFEFRKDGFRNYINEVNSGKTEYSGNGLKEINKTKNATGQEITQTFSHGKIATIERDNRVINFDYVEEGNGLGKLNSVTCSDGFELNVGYNEKDLVSIKEYLIGSENFQMSYDYDEFNRLESVTYPNGQTLSYSYDASGELAEIRFNQMLLYSVEEKNHLGQVTRFNFGEDVVENTRMYNDITGDPELFTNNLNIQKLEMDFDVNTGNLNFRKDHTHLLIEEFGYDVAEKQLTHWKVGGGAIYSIEYDTQVKIGNILTKTDVSDEVWEYDSEKLHALKIIPNPKTELKGFLNSIIYNSLHAPIRINYSSPTYTGNERFIAYKYGAFDDRVKASFFWDGNLKERYYLGNFEVTKEQNEEDINLIYVHAPNVGLVAIIHQSGESTPVIHYVNTDHLGSITKVISETGELEYEQAFDPWGRRRNPVTWVNSETNDLPEWLYRGYTGHEMLDDYGLIHMNGRLYDPLIGRMLSVDNHVQNPADLRNYNRYAYVLNNPLKYRDPTGESWDPPGWINRIMGKLDFSLPHFLKTIAKGKKYHGTAIVAPKNKNWERVSLTSSSGSGNSQRTGGNSGGKHGSSPNKPTTGSASSGGASSGDSSSGESTSSSSSSGDSWASTSEGDNIEGGESKGAFGVVSLAVDPAYQQSVMNFMTQIVGVSESKTINGRSASLYSAGQIGGDIKQAQSGGGVFSTTIINNDFLPVFVKPETDDPNFTGASWKIEAGETKTFDIDGIASQRYNNKVFKISTSPFGYTVTIKSGGEIEIPWYISGEWKTIKEIESDYGAYPANWENIFKSAETGDFYMDRWDNKPSWWGK